MKRTLGNTGQVLRRTAQFALDPFGVLLPGWAVAAKWLGLGRDPARLTTADRLAAGLIVVLPGIEGPSLYTFGIRAGLEQAGRPEALTIFNWAGFWPGGVCALSRRAAGRAAGRLIDLIDGYRSAQPGRPIVLVGHSGGSAIAVRAAERLGPARAVAGLVLLACPLSPGYDLSGALAGVSGGVLACHSRRDWQLRTLTAAGGNFDRRFGRTAGQEGFARLSADPPMFEQLAWDRSMVADGHWGGHVGCTSPRWIVRHVAPRIARWLDQE